METKALGRLFTFKAAIHAGLAHTSACLVLRISSRRKNSPGGATARPNFNRELACDFLTFASVKSSSKYRFFGIQSKTCLALAGPALLCTAAAT